MEEEETTNISCEEIPSADKTEENVTTEVRPSLEIPEEKNLPSKLTEEEKNLPSKLAEEEKNPPPKLSKEEAEKKSSEPDTPNKEEYDAKNVHYEGETAIYTDPKSGYQYKWCGETNQWLPKTDVTYGFEDDTHTYTDTDGVKYFWDKEKNAWFPKIDDEFMARYQMNYGFVDNTTETGDDKKKVDKQKQPSDVKALPEEKEEPSITKEKSKGVKRKTEPPPTPSKLANILIFCL